MKQINEILEEAIIYCDELGKLPSHTQLEKKFSISESLAKHARFFLEHRDFKSSAKSGTKIQRTTDGPNYEIVSTSSEIRTLDQLLKFCKVDLSEWYVKKHVVNSWGSDENENFQVKAWLEKKSGNELSIEEQAEQFKSLVKNYKPNYKYLKPIKSANTDLMFEISIPDFHYGLLSWGEETGNNYDVKIARKIWLDAINHFANIIINNKVSKILFPIGNDFFNVNSSLNQTFSGTPQDEDCRWQKSFSTGWAMVVEGIDILLSVADVDVIIIPGNHDTEKTYYMGEVLKSWYRSCKKISIDNTPRTRKYYRYGNSLIGLCHGKDEPIKDLPLIMAVEAKEEFALTKFWEYQIGHLHHDRRQILEVADNKTVKTRIMPSLVARSAWSKSHAYLSLREAIGLLWDKKIGKIAEFSYYPKEIDE
jgi:hypothetical protein